MKQLLRCFTFFFCPEPVKFNMCFTLTFPFQLATFQALSPTYGMLGSSALEHLNSRVFPGRSQSSQVMRMQGVGSRRSHLGLSLISTADPVGSWPGHCGVLSSIPSLMSGASSNTNNQKYLQASPSALGERHRPSENHCAKGEALEVFEARLFCHPRNGSRIPQAGSLI